MSVREEFLKDIIANPKDDAPRLIYADWLEDNAITSYDKARAQFIRLQVRPCVPAGSNLHAMRCGQCPDCAEIRKLLHVYRRTWLETDCYVLDYEIEDDPGEYRDLFQTSYERGFVHSVTCDLEDWLTYGSLIVRRAPVEHVTVWGKHPVSLIERTPPPEETLIFGWYRNIAGSEPQPYHLPDSLFDRLKDQLLPGQLLGKFYRSTGEAFGALSDALIARVRDTD